MSELNPLTQSQVLRPPIATAAPAGPTTRLPLPASVNPKRIVKTYAYTVVFCHAVALLALLPWFFSWTGVVLAVLGLYAFGTLGINLYYHRMLAHRGLTCPKWFERVLAILAVCCLQDAPARWVAVHRRHHQYADERPDPHSPLVNFFWGHVGWLLVENADFGRYGIYERYAKDIVRDPFNRTLERNHFWIVLLSWAAFFVVGAAASLLTGGTAMQAIQFGSSLFVWGVFVRTVAVWHITWSVNSLSHLWGYRSYDTDESSRNNVFVALISNGEGWHNNHHADPRSARHGHRWWELDVVYLTIRVLASVGLASNVITPNARIAALRATGALATRDYSAVPPS